jgi:hypothetical protein
MLTAVAKQKPLGDRLDLRPIDEEPAFRAELEKLRALEQRLKETQARREQAKARDRGAKVQRPALERARDLVAGARVPPMSAATEIEACDAEEYEILRPAIIAQNTILEEIRGDLSLAACERLKSRHDAALVALLRAIEDAWAAVAASAAIVNRLHALGYASRLDILPALYPPAVVALGDPDAVGASQAALFKERLRKHGIIR